MIKAKIKECIRLTEAILTEHFCEGVRQDTLTKHMDEKCLWIGSIDSEYTKGKDEILYSLHKEAGKLPTFILTSKKFECANHDRKMAVITGRYIGHTEENNKEISRDMQRVTFVWKEKEGFLWLVHFHISNPMNNVEKNEGFPHALGVFTKEYINSLLLEGKNKYIIVKDEKNAYQRLPVSKIIYIEYFDMRCLIHLLDNDVLVKASLSELEFQIKGVGCQIIIRVQKKFAVNKFFVSSIKRYEIEVTNGHTIPVSRSRYKEVKMDLLVAK